MTNEKAKNGNIWLMQYLLGLLESDLNFLKNLTVSQSPANSCHFLNCKD